MFAINIFALERVGYGELGGLGGLTRIWSERWKSSSKGLRENGAARIPQSQITLTGPIVGEIGNVSPIDLVGISGHQDRVSPTHHIEP